MPEETQYLEAGDGTRWFWSPGLHIWTGWNPGEDGCWTLTLEEMQTTYPDLVEQARCR